ncbi:lysyl oxidase-like protein 2 3 4 [Fusarium austroafricanum]|uniref:Lysyl oxidase-like protein 2 3 4 n=1 Tax=Fusarium austroafricanum TaxID=2364996 RepID=A0A8H4KHQ6_9HYPO|nr:lysyl oxidase-like protein 2 3 4 [Fusarium austroafricanum]
MSETTAPQGRRRVTLDQNRRTWKSEEIDDFLLTIDQTPSSQCGPFSAFFAKVDNPSPIDTDAISSQSSFSTTATSPELQFQNPALPIEFLPPDIKYSSSRLLPSLKNEPADSHTIADIVANIELYSASTVAQSLSDNDPEPSDEDRPESLVQRGCSISRAISTSLFQDPEIDALFSHYHLHITSLMIPVDHSENPYRHLYVSTAVEGIISRGSHAKKSREMVYRALYQSLLASAAYHRWYCDKHQTHYRETGARYRYLAMQSLKDAIEDAAPETNYQLLIMTILSFITIGVLSGDGDDFIIHIKAAAQLRNLRTTWKLLSRASRQLNEISAFLTMLCRTVSFFPSPGPWIGYNERLIEAEDRLIESSGCYEFVYGITASIAAAINQTCHLAEQLAQLRHNKHDIPDEILRACEELGNRLQSWTFESETITSISRSDTFAFLTLTHEAKAWHAAALVFYYTRIQGVEPVDLFQETDQVLTHLLAADEVKSSPPITWPAFIACCNVLKDKRDAWREWWENLLSYKVGSIEKQWEIIQQVWEIVDQAEKDRVIIDWTKANKTMENEDLEKAAVPNTESDSARPEESTRPIMALRAGIRIADGHADTETDPPSPRVHDFAGRSTGRQGLPRQSSFWARVLGGEKETEGPQFMHSMPAQFINTTGAGQIMQTIQFTRPVQLDSKGPEAEKFKFEVLHRYNILSCRSRVLRHLEADPSLGDDEFSDQVFQDLSRYSSASRDYRAFRTDEGYLFPSDRMDRIIGAMVMLEERRRDLEGLRKSSEKSETTMEATEDLGETSMKVKELMEEIDELRSHLNEEFQEAVLSITSGITDANKAKERKALWSRLIMALVGGFALIGPMLIMVLHPTKLTSLLTTSIFTFAAAVCLAVFMKDSEPKDVIGFTAAYAAVLVVFIGTGGGT